ncbi:peptidoglycan DD-metalloendopeptidase family protein [Polaromonas sp. YR568]|uniref:M23 family metallopeptidase n=1 Tax=Polaromonas sp. YR568 TaxID=1855301 RepID=UPI003138403B
MHLIITDAWLARSRAIYLSGTKLVLAGFVAALALMLVAAGLYHWVFLKGAREGWPVIGALVKLMVKDEFDQRDRFLRENLDVMAKRVGEMQAKMLQLEALGERVSGLAGVNPNEIKTPPGRGGVLVGGPSLSMQELQATLTELDKLTDQRVDLMTVMESRLFDQKVKKMMVPTQEPVAGGNLGSSFGWRIDPLNGRSALHTGLDFPAASGTAVLAAAGGIVVSQEYHPEYGNLVEIDHGNELVTRYAHVSRVFVKKGDLVKRGQKVAEVGTTGRSTGPHLHFEVLVQGVFQDPQKFLNAGRQLPVAPMAMAQPNRPAMSPQLPQPPVAAAPTSGGTTVSPAPVSANPPR